MGCHKIHKIARDLNDIHDAGKIKTFIQVIYCLSIISDFWMCQPVNDNQQSSKKKEFMEYYLILHQKFCVDINTQKHQVFIHLE